MNAVIIEDENLIAKELIYKIAQAAPDVKIKEVLPSVKTSCKWFLENAEPDLIFADIQLSDGTSFEIFERFNFSCPVVFTTAYDEYAIRAFKVNGIDYLLKPVDEDELKRAIDKAMAIVKSKVPYPRDVHELLRMIANPATGTPQAYKEKFVVKQRNSWVPILTRDIACFYRENLIYLLTFSGDKFILDFVTLDEIEAFLDPNTYYRANRQSIIHIDSIRSIRLMDNQKLIVTLKDPLKMELDISREKAPAFKKWFDR